MGTIEILTIGAMIFITGATIVITWNKKMWNLWLCLLFVVLCMVMMWLSYATGMFEPLEITKKLGWSVFALGALVSGIRSIWFDEKKYPAVFALITLLFSMLVVLRLLGS